MCLGYSPEKRILGGAWKAMHMGATKSNAAEKGLACIVSPNPEKSQLLGIIYVSFSPRNKLCTRSSIDSSIN